MRKPIVAGSFYESDKKALIRQIEEAFKKANGFPSFPSKAKDIRKKNVIGAVIPHAGYFFSGVAAAKCIKEIAESDADVFVILGVNHSGIGANSTICENFRTPLGDARINKGLFEIIKKECDIAENSEAHKYEHSIEVIIPFLQYSIKKFTFVPIIVSQDMELFGKNLSNAIEIFKTQKNKKVCVIASSDMTHFGASYDYLPFKENIRQNMYELDKGAIEFILKKDADSFLRYVEKTNATICGKNTISALIYFLNASKKNSKGEIIGKLLEYYTSADIMGDYRTAVGYAAIIFSQEPQV